MKPASLLLLVAALSAWLIVAQTPDAAVVVNSATVVQTTTLEPREVLFRIARATGEIQAEVTYERVIRVDGVPVSWQPHKVATLNWSEVTNAIPSLAQSLQEFGVAARASLTNSLPGN
jgi:hypothetical protein